MIALRVPALDLLDGYVDALKRGWSPDNVRGAETIRGHLEAIGEDAAGFVARLDDPTASAGPVKLPDGSLQQRLPGFHRWIWDTEFAGAIGFRWAPGTAALPPHVLGHIGFAVVPWKQRRGYATAALALMLPEARAVGLSHVELTTDPDNLASQKVITANGGVLVERFGKPAAYGGAQALRFRIALG
ncbi:MAG: GNAT family N-acetyltransferase [Alphaproteobacteria bacterium]|nr:GNAT family N-acetyltransferase [Alphaproteobacteria bacterium]